MERYNNRYHYSDSGYSQHRYGNEGDNSSRRDRSGEFEQAYRQHQNEPGNQGQWEQQRSRNFEGNRDQDRQSNSFQGYNSRDQNRGSSHPVSNREQGRHQDNRNRDYDNEVRYYDNLRGDSGRMGNVAQGYGISSFDGTSDRYNTLNSRHREDDAQLDQTYYSGRRDGFKGPRFGGGMGDAETHSDRGIPNYGTRSFTEDRGFGMGSSYGATNYGGGTGYGSGNDGGSWGNTSYGNSSGNMGGFGSMGTNTAGGGHSSFGSTSQNSDRGNIGNRNINL